MSAKKQVIQARISQTCRNKS